MHRLAKESFAGTMELQAVGVQHDPVKNSLTHYMRLRCPLGRKDNGTESLGRVAETNGTILQLGIRGLTAVGP